jgi:hypothetical protein
MRGWDFTNIRGDAARYESADAARYVGHLLKEHHRRAVAFDVDGEPQRVRVKAVSQDKLKQLLPGLAHALPPP